LYLVKISSSVVPAFPDWPNALAIIDTITASVDSRKLYIKVDYSQDTFDQSTNTRTGSEPVGSSVWTLNVEDGSYTDAAEIPLYEITENTRSAKIRVFYNLIGIANGGKALLYFPVENGYSLLLVDLISREQRRSNIRFSNEELGYNDFFLSTEGILCAMLADTYNIKMVWWRTDRLMNEMN